MFQAGLLLIIRWYYSVYTAFCTSHAFMLTGFWQDQNVNTQYVTSLLTNRSILQYQEDKNQFHSDPANSQST